MLTRRKLVKRGFGIGIYSVAGTLFICDFTGCISTDQIIEGLKVADQVAKNSKIILDPVNPEVGVILGKVSADIEIVIKGYSDYEKALPSDKPSIADLIKATIASITINLSDVLSAVGVKNSELIQYISIAVAVVNSALTVVLNSLPAATSSSVAKAQASTVEKQKKLPLLKNVKTAKDLKNVWNSVIEKDYPLAKVN